MTEINLYLNIVEKVENLEELIQELDLISEIENSEKLSTQSIGEAILISVIASLIVELIKKTPKYIKKFKELIKNIYNKKRKYSESIEIIIEYKKYTFKIKSEEDIEFQIEELIKRI